MVAGSVIMAYFTSWSIYGRSYNAWDMDASRLSHVNYAFANIQDGLVTLGDAYADTEKVNSGRGDSWSDPADVLHGSFHQLFRLKQAHRHLKVGLSIGGWTWSGQFSGIAQSERARKRFVASAVQCLVDYGFDYIDLDWEYPGGGGLDSNTVSPADGPNFVLLLAEFAAQLQQNFPEPEARPYVTIATACSPKVYTAYPLAAMAQHLRYFNLMCYDFAGPWSPVGEHQANLYARKSRLQPSELCIDTAVSYFLAQGVAPGQLVLGVPFYGREFAACRGLQQPFHGVAKGSWEAGIYDYKALPLPGYSALWERSTNSTFLYSPAARSLISLDDTRSMAYKMDYVLRRGLAGAMFWEISADHPTADERSLLRTIDLWVGRARLDRTPNRMCYPRSRFRNIRDNAVCPSPGKHHDSDTGSARPVTAAVHERILKACMRRLAGGLGATASPAKAHAVPLPVQQISACYGQALAELAAM